jgi:hypothetical protein
MKSTAKAARRPGCAVCRGWEPYHAREALAVGMTVRYTPRQWVATCQSCGREVGRGWKKLG